MKFIHFSLLILFLSFEISYADLLPYISPGFTIAWNSSRMKSASWKVSVGFFSEDHIKRIDGYFCNITLGKRYLLDNFSKDYMFTECEAGLFKGYLFYGSGIGTAYLKKNDRIKIAPKGSLFIGDVLFLRSDFVASDKKLDLDIGGSIVVPINKSYFDNLANGDAIFGL